MSIQSVGNQPTQQAQRHVALVTGGGGGIGEAICSQLASAGMSIVVADIDAQSAAATATWVATLGVDSIWIELDVTEPSSVQRGLAEIGQRLGAVDVLVNCAGWEHAGSFFDSDDQHWRRSIEVNLTGAIRMTRSVVPWMLERGWGRVINIASDAGRIGSSDQALTAAATGGLIAFSKSIAREVVRNGITVNTVCPGPTATPMLDQLISQSEDAAQMIGALTHNVPIGRLGQPQEVAPAVAFFASDAAAFITGQTLSVSGGQTMA